MGRPHEREDTADLILADSTRAHHWDWDAEYDEYCAEAEARGEPHPWYRVPNVLKEQRTPPDARRRRYRDREAA